MLSRILLLLLVVISTSYQQHTNFRPPTITTHPNKEVTFKLKEVVEIPCKASSQPEPTYEWFKDGTKVDIDGVEMMMKPGEGTLVVREPTQEDEGFYQCMASNDYGKAASVKALFRKAVQEGFPTVKTPRVFRPEVGSSMNLTCNPPKSYPAPEIYWGTIRKGSKLTPLDNTMRYQLDYDGTLHITNIYMNDSTDANMFYSCSVYNPTLRSTVQGEDTVVQVKKPRGPVRQHKPRLMWSSPMQDVALTGQTKKMKCIFSGNPSPNVSWVKIDEPFPPKIEYPIPGELPHELVIRNVEVTDAGRYRCIGENQKGQTSSGIINLNVESAPYWRNNRSPEDVNTSDGEDATFSCDADAIPPPSLEWSINGLVITDKKNFNERMVWHDDDKKLTIKNVNKDDIKVIQCNASNIHGYILANVFLNVFAEGPSFKISPDPHKISAEGKNVTLNCKVFGAPKPKVTWYKDGMEDSNEVGGARFMIDKHGNLNIKEAEVDDSGVYTCKAENKFDTDSVAGRLTIRKKTKIEKPEKSDITAKAADPVKLLCDASTDPDESDELNVTWVKDDVPLNYEYQGTGTLDTRDNSLTFEAVSTMDQGRYKCTAATKLDSDSITYDLTVKAPPEPPQDVTVECEHNIAQVSWNHGYDNNEPINGYYVYCNTSWDGEGVHHKNPKAPSDKTHLRFSLIPWNNYTFHMRAENALGLSERSEFTKLGDCVTDSVIPGRNPNDVCTESREPGQLVITWKALEGKEQHGPNFHYVVSYKKEGEEAMVKKIYNYEAHEWVVEDQGVYQPFEIFVQAANQEGVAKDVVKRRGYSGQGVPLETPQNFQILNDTLKAKEVQFQWDKVDEDVSKVQGFFRGYQIQFWREDQPDDVRKQDVIINAWNPCPQLGRKKRKTKKLHRRGRQVDEDDDKVKAHVGNLWPDSKIKAGISVLNGGKVGKSGDLVTFKTPEGVPDPVQSLETAEVGSDHIKVSWDKPEQANGKLIGYDVEYKKAAPELDMIKKIEIDDPEKLDQKIMDLDPEVKYQVSVYAKTKAGRGDEVYKDITTRPADAPVTPPIIADLEVADDSVKVSWNPTDDPENDNPGSKFAVEYKPLDPEDEDDDKDKPDDKKDDKDDKDGDGDNSKPIGGKDDDGGDDKDDDGKPKTGDSGDDNDGDEDGEDDDDDDYTYDEDEDDDDDDDDDENEDDDDDGDDDDGGIGGIGGVGGDDDDKKKGDEGEDGDGKGGDDDDGDGGAGKKKDGNDDAGDDGKKKDGDDDGGVGGVGGGDGDDKDKDGDKAGDDDDDVAKKDSDLQNKERDKDGNIIGGIKPSKGKKPKDKKRKKKKKKGKKNKPRWIRTEPEADNNWINVTGLQNGEKYQFRVVATNNQGLEAVSEPTTTTVIAQPYKEERYDRAGFPWWLLLLLILLLLLLLLCCLICLCCLRCNRGGIYPVHEKEKLRGHECGKDDDDLPFGEYTRVNEPPVATKGSMDSMDKPLEESETDSLGEYDDPDPSKFNEDGSFIGQYGGKKKAGGEEVNPATLV